MGREPLAGDADLVAMYVVRRADDGFTVSTIRVALAAIRTAYLLAGVPLDLSQPRFRMTLEGVVRSRGVRPTRQATPAVPETLKRMLAALPAPDAPLGIRNRAMLLLGFGAALRPSELVGLRIGDVQRVAGRGLAILVRRSKTDQHGRGQQVAIWANPAEPLTCPASARHGAGRRTVFRGGGARRPAVVLRYEQGRPPLRHRAVRQGGRPPG